MERVSIRAKANRTGEGKQGTKYFPRFEKRHYASEHTKLIEKENEEKITEQSEKLQEAGQYYK
ncbi:hypothetical protein BaRGS_00017931, partial [Batillaria attramentaria]